MIYTDDVTHNLVTDAPFTVADVLVGIDAETGDAATRARALAVIRTWPLLRWDAVRAYMTTADLYEVRGQYHGLTRRGRRFVRLARTGRI
jgi:hypothetical protein